MRRWWRGERTRETHLQDTDPDGLIEQVVLERLRRAASAERLAGLAPLNGSCSAGRSDGLDDCKDDDEPPPALDALLVLGQEWEEEEGVSSSSSSTSSAPREEAVEQAPQPRKPRVLFAWPRLQARLEDIASSLCYPPALLAAPRELFFCRVQAQPCRGARGTYPLYCLVTRCESVQEGEGSAPRVAVLLTRSAAVPLQAHASLLSSLRPLLAASMHSNSARAQLRDALEAHPAPSEAAALVSCAPPHSPGRMPPAPPSHSPRWQADHLAAWSLPRLCRALSVPSMLQLLTAALLEHRICVHRGASACTLETSTAAALAPLALLHPFTWQGVLVSALPPQLSALLDAPVPFLVGLAAPCEPQHTLPSDDVTHVCLALDRVTFPSGTPRLPGLKSLSRALAHLHGRCAAGDQHAVKALCAAVQAHLELRLGLSAEALKQHAITRVAPCGERTSALLVGSYIESLGSSSARAFAGGLTQTSAFAALCDERL